MTEHTLRLVAPFVTLLFCVDFTASELWLFFYGWRTRKWKSADATIVDNAVRRRLAATLLVTVLCGTACQTWHTQRVAPESLLATRQPTKVRVTLTDGSQLVLEHPVLRGDTLIEPRYTLSGAGLRHSGEHDVRIPLADVRELATRGFSAGRTVGLGVGVAAALYAAFLVASAIACSGNACY